MGSTSYVRLGGSLLTTSWEVEGDQPSAQEAIRRALWQRLILFVISPTFFSSMVANWSGPILTGWKCFRQNLLKFNLFRKKKEKKKTVYNDNNQQTKCKITKLFHDHGISNKEYRCWWYCIYFELNQSQNPQYRQPLPCNIILCNFIWFILRYFWPCVSSLTIIIIAIYLFMFGVGWGVGVSRCWKNKIINGELITTEKTFSLSYLWYLPAKWTLSTFRAAVSMITHQFWRNGSGLLISFSFFLPGSWRMQSRKLAGGWRAAG